MKGNTQDEHENSSTSTSTTLVQTEFLIPETPAHRAPKNPSYSKLVRPSRMDVVSLVWKLGAEKMTARGKLQAASLQVCSGQAQNEMSSVACGLFVNENDLEG